jgi:hypothetical protein
MRKVFTSTPFGKVFEFLSERFSQPDGFIVFMRYDLVMESVV